MDYGEMYRRWLQSDKHIELKQKFNIKKQHTMMTIEELNRVLNEVIEFSYMSPQDKEVFDWLDEEVVGERDKEELYKSSIKTALNWSFYLRFYEIKEAYELCAKIKRVIDIEIEDTRRMMMTYFVAHDFDLEYLDSLAELAREQINKEYPKYLKNKTNG